MNTPEPGPVKHNEAALLVPLQVQGDHAADRAVLQTTLDGPAAARDLILVLVSTLTDQIIYPDHAPAVAANVSTADLADELSRMLAAYASAPAGWKNDDVQAQLVCDMKAVPHSARATPDHG